jgi:hypothetical protein
MCRFLSGFALLCLAFTAHAELVLSSPPRLTSAAEEKIYHPVAALLSKVIGEPVSYRHPGSYLLYQQEMRSGKYDIVLDGPAFIDWRMQRLGHVPVARLDGDLTFVVSVRRDNTRVRTLDDLTRARCWANIRTARFRASRSSIRLPSLIRAWCRAVARPGCCPCRNTRSSTARHGSCGRYLSVRHCRIRHSR